MTIRRFLAFVIFALGAVASVFQPALARSHEGGRTVMFQDVVIERDQTVNGDLNVVFGNAKIRGTVTGDVNVMGGSCVLAEGGVEWMQAGGGAWHAGGSGGSDRLRGFQLWVALPSALELAPAFSTFLAPEAVAQEGPARVLLGQHGAARSAIPAPASLNYLAIKLKAGERWRYQPPAGHTVAWVALGEGDLLIPESLRQGEMAVFDASVAAIEFQAATDCVFVLGSAVPHPHALVLGRYSVHTSREALQQGQAGIQQIGQRLRNEGRFN